MPMRATTVRFDEALWSLVEREAAHEGVSAAQYVRDAAVMRAAYAMGRRGDAEFEEAIDRVREPRRRPAGDPAARRRGLLEAAAAVRDPDRLAALRGTGLLDSGASPEFDRLA